MLDYQLDLQELTELLAAHRAARDVRAAYRINAVILLAQGRPAADVADALLIDPDTVRDYYKRYKKGGITGLWRMSYIGREARLNDLQLAELERHLRTHLYLTVEAVARSVEKQCGGALHPKRHDGRFTSVGLCLQESRTGTRQTS